MTTRFSEPVSDALARQRQRVQATRDTNRKRLFVTLPGFDKTGKRYELGISVGLCRRYSGVHRLRLGDISATISTGKDDMWVHDTRPAAKVLRYQVYARALHPELFEVCSTRIIEHLGYVLTLRMCEAGHLVELRRNGETIMEINIDEGREIPERGRCLSVPLGTGRDLEAQLLPDVSFQASVQLERLEPHVFERLTREFHADIRRATLSHVFGSRNRMRPGAVSLLFAECSPRSIGIHAFHTFPDDLAIVRTQSLYEFSGPSRRP